MGKKKQGPKKVADQAIKSALKDAFKGATASASVGAPKKKKNMVKKAQKRASSAGVPMARQASMRVDAAPAAYGFNIGQSYFKVKGMKSTAKRGEGVRIRGRDFFDTVQAAPVVPQGTAIANFPINPTSLPGTRLAQFCQLYEKYRFRRFKIIAVPNNATSSSGMYGMSYDRDPTDATPPVSVQGVREYMAMPGTVLASSWKESVMDCPLIEPVTDFYINAASGGDERLVDQGQFYFWMPEDSPTGTTLKWVLIIDYDLELFIPQLGGTLSSVSYVSKIETSPVVVSPSTAAKAGWNTLEGVSNLIATGDTSSMLLQNDSDGNAFIPLLKGIYRIYQTYGANNASGASKSFLWGSPQVVANAGTDSKFIGTQVVDEYLLNIGTASPGAYGITQLVTTLRIPEEGAKLYGNWLGASAFAVTVNSVFFALEILSQGEVFDNAFLAWGSNSKFHRKDNERIKQRHLEGKRMIQLALEGAHQPIQPGRSSELSLRSNELPPQRSSLDLARRV